MNQRRTPVEAKAPKPLPAPGARAVVPCYMIATTALHMLGDLSRMQPSLCVIFSMTDEVYIGNWVTGYGFIDVQFPKATTRELTQAERTEWDNKRVGINGGYTYTIKVPPTHHA